DFLRIYPAVAIEGTALARSFAEGTYRPLSLSAAVSLCKVMLHRSFVAGIPVIRMGLQPTRELEREGTVVAGPFHPAFRQLVESEIFFDLLLRLLSEGEPDAAPLSLRCAPSRISDVIGQGRSNMRRLAQRGVRIASVRPDGLLSPTKIAVEGDAVVRTADILSDLHYTLEDAIHV
ncbi:MAG: radical SAM protein, partial [Geobacteraceae bacterium]|nr:radical SAM protein [Geobacteraceae bacterium]